MRLGMNLSLRWRVRLGLRLGVRLGLRWGVRLGVRWGMGCGWPLAARFCKFRPVLLLDHYAGPSVFGDVGIAVFPDICRHIPVDEDVVVVAVPPVPVVAADKIDARREARIVDIDPFVRSGFHIDGDDARTLEHRPLYL